MKSLFIVYNQAYNQEIIDILSANDQRGFTCWEDIQGRGSVSGIPHMGNHAWPEQNHALMVVVPDDKVDAILSQLKAKDEQAPELGLRAFVWNIETIY